MSKLKSKKAINKRIATKRKNTVVTPTPKKTTPVRKDTKNEYFDIVLDTESGTSIDLSISIAPTESKTKDIIEWMYKLPSSCHPKSFNMRESSTSKQTSKWNEDDFTLDSPIGRGKFGKV